MTTAVTAAATASVEGEVGIVTVEEAVMAAARLAAVTVMVAATAVEEMVAGEARTVAVTEIDHTVVMMAREEVMAGVGTTVGDHTAAVVVVMVTGAVAEVGVGIHMEVVGVMLAAEAVAPMDRSVAAMTRCSLNQIQYSFRVFLTKSTNNSSFSILAPLE